jgi:acetyl esterase/lipase
MCIVVLTLLVLQNSGKQTAKSSTSKITRCYDANDKRDQRLWNDRAAGAVGDDPCKDIPYLRIFLPSGSVHRTDAAIIIIPGGGYDQLKNTREQAPVAEYFANKLGITSFILYYRLVQANGTYRYPVPMWDGQRALRYVRQNAARFGIKTDHVGVFGFSAGGHLASTIALHSDQNFDLPKQDNLDKTNARPDILGLGYPVISMEPNQHPVPNSIKNLLNGYTGNELKRLQDFLSGQKHVNAKTPPTFLFESLDDRTISAQNSVLFAKALKDAGVPNEARIFKKGKHGVGLAQNESMEHVWPELFDKWLIASKFIPKS